MPSLSTSSSSDRPHNPSAASVDSGAIPAPLLTLAAGTHPEIDLEIKRSHFLGRVARTDCEEDARAFIADVRSAHPTARHHCSAFIIHLPDALPIERSSDDGEPSGTAGGPMLEVLRGSTLVNVTAVVSRYFGGTLLGTGGLVRAYTDATLEALAAASKVQLARRFLWDVAVDFTLAGRLEADLRALAVQPLADLPGGLTIEESSWSATGVTLTLSTASPDASPLTALLASLTAGTATPTSAGTRVVESPLP